jgi:hypothetical protein
MPTKDLAKYGLSAAAPALLAPPEYKKPELDSEQYRYAYSPGPVMPPTRSGDVGEYTYFRPSYTRLAEGGSTDQYRYEYDPVRQAYKQSLPPTTAAGVKSTGSGDMRGDGGDMSSSGQPGRSGGMNPATTIGIGQALQGYSQLGFAPGSTIAGLIGDAVVNSGVNQFGAMEGLAGLSASQGYGLSDPSVGQGERDAISYAEHSASTAAPEAGPSSGYSADASSGWGTDYATGGITALARGGYSHLGDYSDGGRLLRGPGDGVSDSIPAVIGQKRPARLADGEFVVPARIVSELGNGSTEAGARKLYAMMNRVQAARGKTTGKGKVAKNTRAEKYLPA